MEAKVGIRMILALSVTIVMAVTGCTGNNIKLEGSGDKGSLTYKTEDGNEITLSSKGEVPEGFPSEIPLPGGMDVTASTHSENSGNYTVSVEIEKPFDDVLKIYRDYIKDAGYTQTLEMKEEGYYMYSGTRGDELFMITFNQDQENKKLVTGALVYEKKP
ncbi:hypothetical protein [Cohnella cholangitidis]|uniref:Lipoprotein n=1 Tax=Cohnella cholangitidis TaxID=2598458 RepID=A0A7G5C0M2_9BACL|nr:hypothetical protein [Cohnella cholangitidis]QMV42756.1 hypothetical protein FPL14_17345 [Cohnella cholangitidis]